MSEGRTKEQWESVARSYQKHITRLQNQIEKMKCCGNCKYGNEGEYDCFENCSSCTAMYCICQKTKKEMDWTDKCDEWELAERELAE